MIFGDGNAAVAFLVQDSLGPRLYQSLNNKVKGAGV